ncbi:hypothetical protein TRVL_05803 [Trypanosoma vivax]|nr:hypothetical protein TRVL_05803 [Trypanosoma vivax]
MRAIRSYPSAPSLDRDIPCSKQHLVPAISCFIRLLPRDRRVVLVFMCVVLLLARSALPRGLRSAPSFFLSSSTRPGLFTGSLPANHPQTRSHAFAVQRRAVVPNCLR